MKTQRKKFVSTYEKEYGTKLPDEIFQSDCMTDLVSELDSSEVSSDHCEEDYEEDEETLQAKKAEKIEKAKLDHAATLRAHARLTPWERRAKVKVWEEKKPEFRSFEVSTVSIINNTMYSQKKTVVRDLCEARRLHLQRSR